MSDYFIADTHFGDKRIMNLENRPFKTVDDMDNYIINRWNEEIDDLDTVYVLGDFTAYMEEEKVKGILSQLKGFKVLVMGNHDEIFLPKKWQELGFDLVMPYPIIVENFFILSHEPMYVNKNGAYANIFGHVHGNPNYKSFSELGACVSCERINYTPISFDNVVCGMDNEQVKEI